MAKGDGSVRVLEVSGREMLALQLAPVVGAEIGRLVRAGGYHPTAEQWAELGRLLAETLRALVAAIADPATTTHRQVEEAALDCAGRIVHAVLGPAPRAH